MIFCLGCGSWANREFSPNGLGATLGSHRASSTRPRMLLPSAGTIKRFPATRFDFVGLPVQPLPRSAERSRDAPRAWDLVSRSGSHPLLLDVFSAQPLRSSGRNRTRCACPRRNASAEGLRLDPFTPPSAPSRQPTRRSSAASIGTSGPASPPGPSPPGPASVTPPAARSRSRRRTAGSGWRGSGGRRSGRRTGATAAP